MPHGCHLLGGGRETFHAPDLLEQWLVSSCLSVRYEMIMVLTVLDWLPTTLPHGVSTSPESEFCEVPLTQCTKPWKSTPGSDLKPPYQHQSVNKSQSPRGFCEGKYNRLRNWMPGKSGPPSFPNIENRSTRSTDEDPTSVFGLKRPPQW